MLLAPVWAAGGTRGDEANGVVVDLASWPLSGVTVQFLDGSRVLATTWTGADGAFALGTCGPNYEVRVSLSGFETVTVACPDAARIVLPLRKVSETLDVVASAVAADSPTSLLVGTALSRVTMQHLPTASQHTRDALPLLPSVIRGVDGLLHIDGVRPHESPLLIDGFNVTDPASGVSSIDLPLESVKSTQVLRDPMSVTFGGALGSLVAIETRSGGDSIEGGIQGFVPRPRLTGGGFGRLEGFSPRAFASGSAGAAMRYVVSGEFDFDRIPVPGVTTRAGTPDTRQVGGALFGRVDLRLTDADSLGVEGIFFPRTQRLRGLSPLRSVESAPTVRDSDLFGGVVTRHAFAADSILTVRLGFVSHRTQLEPNGDGAPEITPDQWRGGFFSTLQRRATRVEGGASWQGRVETGWGLHELNIATTAEDRSLVGTVSERMVAVRDAEGRLARTIRFGRATAVGADDGAVGVALRDLWQATERLQLDAGVRGDWSGLAGFAPSARLGVRFALGDDATVLKGGVGTFVGSVPLAAAAFGGFPVRFDEQSPEADRAIMGSQPAVGRLRLPRALTSNLRVERQLAPGWDAMVGVGFRRSTRLATVSAQPPPGPLLVASTGASRYREAEVALRHTWREHDQVFISYTRSSSHGEINDFLTLFSPGDLEILQPAGVARLASDVPHRLLAWSTVTLPFGFGVSPAFEWRSGFPYSVFDGRRAFLGSPNSSSFPAFLSLDLVVDKAITLKRKSVKLQVQLFNATNHFNPRDVYAVADAPRFGTFVNSVGPTLRGDIGIGW